jgi:hypothetical protein
MLLKSLGYSSLETRDVGPQHSQLMNDPHFTPTGLPAHQHHDRYREMPPIPVLPRQGNRFQQAATSEIEHRKGQGKEKKAGFWKRLVRLK